jgi:hypothetical protein
LPIVRKSLKERCSIRCIVISLRILCCMSRFQSGFRPKHSTLSALIQMCDD